MGGCIFLVSWPRLGIGGNPGKIKDFAVRDTRCTEDIPPIRPEVTEHTIYRHWCPGCQKYVTAPVTDAMENANLSLKLVVVAAWLHYATPRHQRPGCRQNFQCRLLISGLSRRPDPGLDQVGGTAQA